MEAPFKVGGAVEPPYFADREKDIELLERSAKNLDQNYLILAPRRFGKTSLLLNLRRRLEGKKSLLVPYINCREAAGVEDLYHLVTRAVVEELERKRKLRGLWQRFRSIFGGKLIQAVHSLEEIGGELGNWGRVYLRFREKEVDEGEVVRATFHFLGRVASEHRVGMVLLLDEFQEVVSFDKHIFSVLKAEMDRRGNVRYFFSGSSLGLLRDIFLKDGSPLYLMVARYRLGPLPKDEALEFLRERFRAGGLDIDGVAAEKIFSLTGGIPFYLQKLGLMVFQRSLLVGKSRVSIREVEEAFAEMLTELDAEFEVRWLSKFSPLQRRILRALAELGEGRITQIARAINMEPQDISSSLTRLREAMVVEKEETIYRLVDVVFSRWISSM